MKKTMSILLALTMLFALCIPAFAAPEVSEIIAPAPKSGSTVVQTDLSFLPSADGYFTVTIPADAQIPWGQTTAIDLHYSVESHLTRDKRLSVTVDASGAMKTTDGVYSLPYQLNGGAATGFTATTANIFPAQDCKLDLTVAQEDWDKAVVETFKDTLTFNVTVA